ncbi:hypothetical protein M673_11540 [Aureimonas sp. AU20]|nr:hypothetical protein M673_11540 [Aureimonas sp. AU20]
MVRAIPILFQSEGNGMRAEIQSIVDEIQQAVSLLRRHL